MCISRKLRSSLMDLPACEADPPPVQCTESCRTQIQIHHAGTEHRNIMIIVNSSFNKVLKYTKIIISLTIGIISF